ncbi:MAG: TetR/AcrR family transcriptional regulator [Paracoccaceae bacterium]
MPRRPSFDRDALIEQARDLFWHRGWAGTSLKDLERELKLKPGSFYAAFGSKDALYALALERYAQDGVARLTGLANEIGPLETLKTQLQHVVDPTRETKACMLAKSYLELKAQNDELADHAGGLLKAMERCFADLFRHAQSEGQVDPSLDPDRLARRYQSDLMGLRVSAERDDVDAMELARDIADDLDRLHP